MLIAIAMLLFMRESGADRAAARAYGSVRTALRAIGHDRNLVLVFVSGMLGGGGRGLGVLNVFVPLYLSLVLGLDAGTVAIMYTALVVLSVPGPIVAGSLSDRFGRKPLILAAYIGGAAALVGFLLAGDDIPMLWVAILFLGIFNFVESPQLQALLGDLAPPQLRDASFSAYFTFAFGIGSLWIALYGWVIAAFGEDKGLPICFLLMAGAFLAAAVTVIPIQLKDKPKGSFVQPR
jgi:MFS family permease